MSNFVASCSLCLPAGACIDVLVIEFLATSNRSFFSRGARAKFKSGLLSSKALWQENVVQLNLAEHFPSSLPRLQLRLRVPSPGRKDLKSSSAAVCIPSPRSGGPQEQQQLALQIKKDGKVMETKVMLTLCEAKAAALALDASTSTMQHTASQLDPALSYSPGTAASATTPSTLGAAPEAFEAAPSGITLLAAAPVQPPKPANKRPWWSLSQLLSSFSNRNLMTPRPGSGASPAAPGPLASPASETGSMVRNSCAFFHIGGSSMVEDLQQQPSGSGRPQGHGAAPGSVRSAHETPGNNIGTTSVGSVASDHHHHQHGRSGSRELHRDSVPGAGGASPSRGSSQDGGGGSPLHKRARVSGGPGGLTHLWSIGRHSKVSVVPLAAAGSVGLPPLPPRPPGGHRTASGAATPDGPSSPTARMNPAQLAFGGLLSASEPPPRHPPHPPSAQHSKPPLCPNRVLGRPASLGSHPRSPDTAAAGPEQAAMCAAAASAISQHHGDLISRECPASPSAAPLGSRGGTQSAPLVSRESSLKRPCSGQLDGGFGATKACSGASDVPSEQQGVSAADVAAAAGSSSSHISSQLRQEICEVIHSLTLLSPAAGTIISPRRFEFKQSLEALLRCDQADESVARATLDSVVMEIAPFDKGTPLADGYFARDLVLREPAAAGLFKRVSSCPDVANALQGAADAAAAAAAAPPAPVAPSAPSHRHTQSAAWTSALDAPRHVRVRAQYASLDQVSAGGSSACTCIALEVVGWLEENSCRQGKAGAGAHMAAATLTELVMQGCSLWRAAGGQGPPARAGGQQTTTTTTQADTLLGFHAALEMRNQHKPHAGSSHAVPPPPASPPAPRSGGTLYEVQSAYCQVGPQGLKDPTTTLPAFVSSATAAAAAAGAAQSFVLVAMGHSTAVCFQPDDSVLLINSLGRSLSPNCKHAHILEFGSSADFAAAFVSISLPAGAQPAQVEAHRVSLQPVPGGEPDIQLFMPQS